MFREKQGIEVFLRHQVNRIDLKTRQIETVSLRDGKRKIVPYDRLVFAPGARSRRLGLAWEDAENFFTLKDLRDAIRIKDYVNREAPERAGILGAGYIGLEMVEAFVQRGMETTVIARGDRPASHLEPEVSGLILEELKANGVRFVPGQPAGSVGVQGSGRISTLETSSETFAVDLLLGALGVVPNTGILQGTGLELGKTGAVRTDNRQATRHPDIYTAGDCCEAYHRVLDRWVHMPLGDVANKQGRVAGENAAGGEAYFHGIIGSQCFKLFSLQVASTGITEKTADEYGIPAGVQTIRGNSAVHYMPGAEPLFLKLVFHRDTGKILGAHMAGRDGVARRINTMAVAVQTGMTVETLSRMDFAYAPHFSPPSDPILVAAEQALKKI